MEINVDNMIKTTKKICYGSIHGLIEIDEGTILHIHERLLSDDGVETKEGITFDGQLGKVTIPYEIFDHEYEICSKS